MQHLSLHKTNLVLNGKVARVVDHNSLVTIKIITLIKGFFNK